MVSLAGQCVLHSFRYYKLLFDHRQAVWYITSFVSVFLSLCQAITFESLDVVELLENWLSESYACVKWVEVAKLVTYLG